MDSTAKGEPIDRSYPKVARRQRKTQAPSVAPLLPSAPKLMLVFWMLLGSVAGITLAQSVWRMTGWSTGAFAIAVPVGAVAGTVGGGLVGQITRPSMLVLIMALLAGWSVGALCGGLVWAETGQIPGGFVGALAGGLTWTVCLRRRRENEIP